MLLPSENALETQVLLKEPTTLASLLLIPVTKHTTCPVPSGAALPTDKLARSL
jgi:hypothetical protein